MKKKQSKRSHLHHPITPTSPPRLSGSEQATERVHCAEATSTCLATGSPFKEASFVEEALKRYPGSTRDYAVVTYLALRTHASVFDLMQCWEYLGKTDDGEVDATPQFAAAFFLAGDIKNADKQWKMYLRMKREEGR
jgi:hypothetical protein